MPNLMFLFKLHKSLTSAFNGHFLTSQPAFNGNFLTPQTAFNGHFLTPQTAFNGHVHISVSVLFPKLALITACGSLWP